MAGKARNTLLPVLLCAAAGALAAHFLTPAHTPPLRSKRGARGIAKLEKVRIGGTEQWVLIRSEDVEANPILLILHGGPGCSEMALHRRHTGNLERHFTVVNWDQRGAGRSYRAGKDKSRMTIEQFVEDIGELSVYLLRRFGKEKLVLMGRSWGSAIGMLAVKKHPELFSAYVGVGQIANMEEGEKASYNWTLFQARTNGNAKALGKLKRMGPPPYTGDWLKKFNTQRQYVAYYGGEVRGNRVGGNGKLLSTVLFSPEYSFTDRLNYNRSVQESMKLLHPQLMQVNLAEAAPQVDVPVFFMEGRYDHVVPAKLAARYYEALEAPHKELTWFERSAHMPDIEESVRFNRILVEKVWPVANGQAAV